jgi:SAM-dependent methyltransferase
MSWASNFLFFNVLAWKLPRQINHASYEQAVDLGCGANPRNPLSASRVIGIDLSNVSPFAEERGLEYRQIGDKGKIPVPDESLDCLTAFDVIEHLPRQTERGDDNLFIGMMNEIHRTLKPGGIFLAVTPCYPSSAAFLDPTHVNIITPDTHKYFSDEAYAKGLNYGFTGGFKTIAVGWYPFVGSWIDDSKIKTSFVRSNLLVSFVKRLLSLSVFYLFFPWKRTHFVWVLERV